MAIVADDRAGLIPGAMNQLVECLKLAREQYVDMTVSQLLIFAAIAAQEGMSQIQIMEQAGMTDAGVSRTIGLLSRYGSRRTEGLELVEIRMNEDDRRFQAIYLTRKGRQLAARMGRLIGRG